VCDRLKPAVALNRRSGLIASQWATCTRGNDAILRRTMRARFAPISTQQDTASAPRQRQGDLARATSDLEHPSLGRFNSNERENVIDQENGIFTAFMVIKLRDFIEGVRAQKPSLFVSIASA
jgi:hypothetical protein